MKIAILGSGARENAVAWKLAAHNLWILRGNAGTAQFGTNVDIDPEDVDAVSAFAKSHAIDLVVVGPEGPLAKGVVDRLSQIGISAFGPTQAAAQLEWSKSFGIQIMQEAGVYHPRSWFFDTVGAVRTFFRDYKQPIVVKADGLAGGKGVFICYTEEEVLQAARSCMRISPGRPIVVQEKLEGREVSVFCFTDYCSKISSLVAACDYKRQKEGNEGPMTGGMGSYAWPAFWTDELATWVRNYIMLPVLLHMALRGTPFQGVLYAGLMLCEGDTVPARVLEFNDRFGDPEAQVILPLLKNDLFEVLQACTRTELDLIKVEWGRDVATVGVVLASEGYPQEYIEGAAVLGLENLDSDILVFHGGSSGRMMTLVAIAPTLEEATSKIYNNIGRLTLIKAFCRQDIGMQAAVAH